MSVLWGFVYAFVFAGFVGFCCYKIGYWRGERKVLAQWTADVEWQRQWLR